MGQISVNLSQQGLESTPNFDSHSHARTWFEMRFGDSFLHRSTDILDGQPIYYYHLIIDREAYQKYMEFVWHDTEELFVADEHRDLLYSYCTVEISEDGETHIIT